MLSRRLFLALAAAGTALAAGCGGGSSPRATDGQSAFDPGPLRDVNYTATPSSERWITVDGKRCKADQLLVSFGSEASDDTVRAVLVKHRLRILDMWEFPAAGSRTYFVETPQNSDLSALRQSVAAESGVKDVELNLEVKRA